MSEEAVAVVQADETPAQTETSSASTDQSVKSYLNEDGSWNRDAFGDELGKHSIFDKYKSPDELVKATINKDHLIGKKAEDFWTSEDPDIVSKRLKIIGVPESADGYEWSNPEGFDALPDDAKNGITAYLKESAAWAKEHGVPKKLFAEFVERDLQKTLEMQKVAAEQAEEAYQAMENENKDLWKNKYEYNDSKAVERLRLLELDKYFTEDEIKNTPKLKRWAFEKLTNIDDDQLIESRQTQTLSTIEDSLKNVEDEIFDFPADQLKSAKYEGLVKKRQDLLSKLQK